MHIKRASDLAKCQLQGIHQEFSGTSSLDARKTITTTKMEKTSSISLTVISTSSAIRASTMATKTNTTKLSPPHLMKLILIAALMILVVSHLPLGECVDCFKCISRNGSNPACEDPFHNLNTTRVTTALIPDPEPTVVYQAPCLVGRKGREGLFPASACLKLIGVDEDTGEKVVVRHCALDSGSLTQDTEIARMSHCGKFIFEEEVLTGCVLACSEDACNLAPHNGVPLSWLIILALLTLSRLWL